ncbi:low temperature requirement protein A [Plantactinospora solaniradicis]|uniref:Low temperature requirement protein A n=1 Tax=Plantactinospora solaniradicis TaxID=1723736 RepID=A0ABW1KN83_9ACTN
MRDIFRSRPVLTEQTHRATPFEIFFDLVFIFALTRIIAFMGQPPTFSMMVRGLLLLVLLWFSWAAYTWLGNQARADVGLVRSGTLLAMAATFVAALVIPDAWRTGEGVTDAPLTLVLAYIVLRGVQLSLFYYSAVEDRALRARLRLFAIPITLAWIPLVLGALLGGDTQTLLWAVAFLVDIGGQRAAYTVGGGWRLRSPSHFAERHGLVLIIALGESLISVGTGAGTAVTRGPVLVAALLGLTTTVCLWWLYFEHLGPVVARALSRASGDRRDRIASDSYGLAYLLLIAGIIYLALGVEQVVAHVAHDQPRHFAGEPLSWTSTIALYGGAVLYLAGRPLILWFAVRSAPPPTQLAAVGVALLLLPVGRVLPALAALGLITALLVTLVCYERLAHGARTEATGGTEAGTP